MFTESTKCLLATAWMWAWWNTRKKFTYICYLIKQDLSSNKIHFPFSHLTKSKSRLEFSVSFPVSFALWLWISAWVWICAFLKAALCCLLLCLCLSLCVCPVWASAGCFSVCESCLCVCLILWIYKGLVLSVLNATESITGGWNGILYRNLQWFYEGLSCCHSNNRVWLLGL